LTGEEGSSVFRIQGTEKTEVDRAKNSSTKRRVTRSGKPREWAAGTSRRGPEKRQNNVNPRIWWLYETWKSGSGARKLKMVQFGTRPKGGGEKKKEKGAHEVGENSLGEREEAHEGRKGGEGARRK